MKNELGTFVDLVGDDFKTKNNVLKENETEKDRLWKKCVEEAKLLVTQYKNARFKVAELAMRVCILHHGGRASIQRYTIRQFAKEIGMPEKTLWEWVRMKRNIYDNLDEKQREGLTLSQMKYMDMKLKGVERDDKFKPKLLKAYKEMSKKSETTVKMEKYLQHLKSIHFNFIHKLMLKDCDPEVLGEIIHLCRDIVFHGSKFDKKKDNQ